MSKYKVQTSPLVVPTNDGKTIKEHFGLATNNNGDLSMAHMIAPPGWSEPFQTPEFDEYTFIISGKKQIIVDGDTIVLNTGESIKINKNARVQYSNPFLEPCEYLAICTPAFSMETVNREE
ncbi:cupin domain-containing protein [Mangrovimonas aestuarii]|uniref:cupin domain-containing protein n=1 Tax=Mangrovimonas aestuarii TaxID=3018443 RepID=UPI002379D20D|nr:cupin domain-containing protein [Mangrovimonas aestuarii]